MTATPTTTSTKVVTDELHRVRRGRKKAFAPTPAPLGERKPARIAVMLAHAHMIRRAIDSGQIRDQAEAARRLRLTRVRLTQILDLASLAPDVQQQILLLDESTRATSVSERALRSATRSILWADHRARLQGEW